MSPRDGWKKRVACGRRSRQCLTCRVHGKFFAGPSFFDWSCHAEDGLQWTSRRVGEGDSGQCPAKIRQEVGAQVVSRSRGARSASSPKIFFSTSARSSRQSSSTSVEGSRSRCGRCLLKLEAAISALGEDDPAVSGLEEALQRARSQAQVRPLSQRMRGPRSLLPEPRSVSRKCARRWSKPSRQSLLHRRRFAKRPFSNGVSRLAALQEEAGRANQPNFVPPTPPAHFTIELATLRECVQELRRERDDLRVELATVGGRGELAKEDENVGEPFSRFNDH